MYDMYKVELHHLYLHFEMLLEIGKESNEDCQ